ncbi:retrovirus-related pol polyprotein from transposon TNT 1-94 [Tanacetum coccineum]
MQFIYVFPGWEGSTHDDRVLIDAISRPGGLRVPRSIESYYSMFYKMMNEMVRNQLEVATMQVNVQFLQQLHPEWKLKRAKDYTYHNEKMLLCKQAEKCVPLQAEQVDWLEETDEEVDVQELEAHYNFMAKIQERQLSEQPESINNTCVVEKVDSNVIPDSSDMCNNDNQADQNAEECDDERDVLANLIVNLKLNTDENKKIQKQLKKANTSLSHELQECKFAHEECKSILDESNKSRDRYLVSLHDKEVELEKYKIFKDHTIENDTLERKLKETLGLLAQKEHDIKEASNCLERLPAGSISTWEDLTTHFLPRLFPPRRTAKLCNDILMFQQHQGESLSESWTRFKDLLQKVPHHGIDRWLQI